MNAQDITLPIAYADVWYAGDDSWRMQVLYKGEAYYVISNSIKDFANYLKKYFSQRAVICVDRTGDGSMLCTALEVVCCEYSVLYHNKPCFAEKRV